MARELERFQLIERTIIKTYRKEIWNPFIQGVKNYRLVNDGDVIHLKLENTADSMLLAKLLQQLKRVSETDFKLVITGNEECEKNAELLNIKLSDNAENCNKLASCDTLSDVCESVLEGLLYNGVIKAPLPCEKEVIRPLYCVSRNAVEKWVKYNSLSFDERENKSKTVEILKKLKKQNPDTENNILNSLSSLCLDTMIGYTENGDYHSFLENY